MNINNILFGFNVQQFLEFIILHIADILFIKNILFQNLKKTSKHQKRPQNTENKHKTANIQLKFPKKGMEQSCSIE